MRKCILLILPFLVWSCITLPSGDRIEPYRETVLHRGGDEKLLVINISGMIVDRKPRNVFGSDLEMNITASIREQLDKARKDDRIKGIVLKINSPGGSVTVSDIIYHEIMTYKKETGNYVIAQLGDMAASGGYYIATSADEIIAHPTTVTGSIGVIITMVNIEGLMEKIGIQNETVTSGKSKEMGSILKKMTPEEEKLFQEITDIMYARFIAVVLKGRKELTPETLKPVADGRVLASPQALKAKLIDHIGYWDDTVKIAAKHMESDDPTIISYTRPGRYTPNVYSRTSYESSGNINILSLDTDLFYSKYGISFMYLWKP
ncbi:MAG: signal peptide peptidase SppA [Spirochaetota bacterium]